MRFELSRFATTWFLTVIQTTKLQLDCFKSSIEKYRRNCKPALFSLTFDTWQNVACLFLACQTLRTSRSRSAAKLSRLQDDKNTCKKPSQSYLANISIQLGKENTDLLFVIFSFLTLSACSGVRLGNERRAFSQLEKERSHPLLAISTIGRQLGSVGKKDVHHPGYFMDGWGEIKGGNEKFTD